MPGVKDTATAPKKLGFFERQKASYELEKSKKLAYDHRAEKLSAVDQYSAQNGRGAGFGLAIQNRNAWSAEAKQDNTAVARGGTQELKQGRGLLGKLAAKMVHGRRKGDHQQKARLGEMLVNDDQGGLASARTAGTYEASKFTQGSHERDIAAPLAGIGKDDAANAYSRGVVLMQPGKTAENVKNLQMFSQVGKAAGNKEAVSQEYEDMARQQLRVHVAAIMSFDAKPLESMDDMALMRMVPSLYDLTMKDMAVMDLAKLTVNVGGKQTTLKDQVFGELGITREEYKDQMTRIKGYAEIGAGIGMNASIHGGSTLEGFTNKTTVARTREGLLGNAQDKIRVGENQIRLAQGQMAVAKPK